MTTRTYKRPDLYAKQERAFFGPERYSLIEASTKSGKTVGAMVWLFEQAAVVSGGKGRNFWWVAPILAQAKIAFRRMKLGLPLDVYQANDTDSSITLGNGAVIWFKGSDNPDSLYGEDVYAAVIDEASRVKEEAWFALRSTLTATKGPIRIVGNVKGRRNWFYRMARVAPGESDMAYHKITADDAVAAGVIDEDEVKAARRDLPESAFQELYYAEANDDEGNPFGLDRIAACVTSLSFDQPAVWGWDLAKSHDWTVGIALDRNRKVCRFHRFQMPWPETRERIHMETANRPALLDSTGVGDPVLEELQRMGSGWFEGLKYTSQSKQELMLGLRNSIQTERIGYPEGPIRLELDSFEYTYTRTGVLYSAPEGYFDDCVNALALADKHFKDKNITPIMEGARRVVVAPRSF